MDAGIGPDNAIAMIDNVIVQAPAAVTETFDGVAGVVKTDASGAWTATGRKATGSLAQTFIPKGFMSVPTDLSGISTSDVGCVFEQQAALPSSTSMVLVGH